MTTNVSIIVPVYNGAEFIEETLRQLICSSLQDIEVIIVDDGSKDNSYAICEMLAKEDRRIRLYRKKNEGGVFAARNFGLAKASGEYICFCDQDDYVEDYMYAHMYAEAKGRDADMVICSTGRLIRRQKEPYEILPDLCIEGRDAINRVILGNLFADTDLYPETEARLSATIWKCMVRSRFLKEHGICFRKYVNYEDDWLFLLDILSRADKVSLMSEVLYYWRINLKSETYVTSYVENLYEKDQRLQTELEQILEAAGVNKTYCGRFHQHYNCTRAVNLIENEMRSRGRTWKEKKKTIQKIMKEPDFKKSLVCRRYYHHNLVRKKIALALMGWNMPETAYIFLSLFHRLKLAGIKHGSWTKLEKAARNY